MYEELKNEVKECEGYVNKIYKCSEGFDTIFYGHKVLPEDNYEHGVEYPKELGEEVFEKDFQRTVDAAERLINSRDDILRVIDEGLLKVGDEIQLKILRDDEVKYFSLKLAERK